MSQRAPRSTPGFDPKQFAAAAGQPKNDPWTRREAWRYTGPFTRWNRFKGGLPGLAWGSGAFVVYLAYEQLFMKDDHGHHGAEHGKEGH